MTRSYYTPPPVTKAQREAHAGWKSPYATDPKCEHDGQCVEVTRTVPNPHPEDPYYLHIYFREWACGRCGAPVNPHSYPRESRVPNQEARREAVA